MPSSLSTIREQAGRAGILNTTDGCSPVIESRGGVRDGAWVAEATGLVEMTSWPPGPGYPAKERPHPGTQLGFTDSDGLRVTAFITDTDPVWFSGQLGGLELRHRQHARMKDRIRKARATGLRNLPCHRVDANAAWLEIILAATDLVAWTKLIGATIVLVQPVPLLAVEQLSDCTSHPAARL